MALPRPTIAAAAGTLLCLLLAPASALGSASGSISGTVTAQGGGPLEGIHVCAPPGFGGKCADTDSNGEYAIAGLAEGSYRVHFDGGTDYASQYYDGTTSEHQATQVTVSSETTATGIDAELAPAARIEGEVTDAAGVAPLQGIHVCPMKPTGSGDTAGECATTGSDGTYVIAGLPAGSYRVQFSSSYPNPEYLTQYYNGKPIAGEGVVLSIAAGETASAVDADMEAAGKIGGTVTVADGGTALQGAQVCAVSPKLNVGLPTCASTDASGQYTISGLPTGSYKVRFSAETTGADYLDQYYSDEPTRRLAKPVSVTAGATTTGIDAAVQAGGEIKGRVTGGLSEEPLSNLFVCVRPVGQPDFEAGGLMCDYTDSNGEYAIGSLSTGSYFVRFGQRYTDSAYLRQYYDGKAGRSDATPVDVVAGETVTGIDASLQEGGRIAGRVTDALSHDPVSPIRVCARDPNQSEEEKEEEVGGGCGFTDSSGEYEIEGLPSGSYEVEFSPGASMNPFGEPPDYAYATQYYDGRSSGTEADLVQVTAGLTTTGIDAAMAEGGSISGTIVDLATKDPVGEVQVCALMTDDDEASRCASTDASGDYTIEGLASGDYDVEFHASEYPEEERNYLRQYYDGKGSLGDATAVAVTAGAVKSGVDAELRPGGQISGSVTASDGGAPLQAIDVCAFEAAAEGELLACTSTDVNGGYTISGLPTGSYKVEFSKGYPDFEGGTEEAFATQFFPGAPSAAQAEPVAVTVGARTGSIDAEMVEAGPGSREGQEEARGDEGGGGGGGATPAANPAGPGAERAGSRPHGSHGCPKGEERKRRHGRTRCMKAKHRHHRRHRR
jgi:Carboxypeptidase regulatory-like domain